MDSICIWQWILSNQDHFWYALAGIGSIGTFFIAIRALRTWRDEKEYDLIIENLALCNSAVQFIQILRSPLIYSSEISEEYNKKLLELQHDNKHARSAAEAMFLYQSRKDKQQDIYEQILKLREKDWAVFGSQHDFYKFLNRIVELDAKIRDACSRQYYAWVDRDDYGDDISNAIIRESRIIMYSTDPDKDAINKELNEWVIRLQLLRKERKMVY